jgi:hypothetical protein
MKINTIDNVDDVIGKIIVKITDENDDLQLHLENGEIIYFSAEGDCCSESWVEHIESPKKPEKILEIKEIEISDYKEEKIDYKKKKKEEIDCLSLYFYQINTDGGSYLIELRNNSNGYYGGYLERNFYIEKNFKYKD